MSGDDFRAPDIDDALAELTRRIGKQAQTWRLLVANVEALAREVVELRKSGAERKADIGDIRKRIADVHEHRRERDEVAKRAAEVVASLDPKSTAPARRRS